MRFPRPFLSLISLGFLFAVSGCTGSHTAPVPASHKVAVAEVLPLGKSLTLPAVGRATSTGAGNSYRIVVPVPKGAKVATQKGHSIRITLPILHHQDTQGSVVEINEKHIEILLSQQVQELNGQSVRVEIPLSGEGLFRVPFTAIYSPRGINARVFVVQGDKAEGKPAEVISLYGDTEVLIAAPLKAGDRVVVQGTDNLLSGDTVEVLAQEGSSK